ncbi:MAG TPA: hypothetical protein VK807_10420 [Gemmatimonadaceae bacterium]|nr:hypothetical protein [Gemmatimonadaceae bacterium]
MRWPIGVAIAGILSGLPCRAAAQFLTTIDANVANATYDGYLTSAVYTVAPAVVFGLGPIRAGADGAYSEFESGHGSGIVGVNALGGTKIYGPLYWELGTEGTALWYRSNPPVVSGDFTPRLRLDRGPFKAWVGGAFGSSDNDSLHGSFVDRAEAGLSYALPHVTPVFTIATTHAGHAQYTDVDAAIQSELGRFSVIATGGHRAGTLLGGSASWLSAELHVTLTSNVAFVFAGGSYPVDLVRGTPGARFISAGFRLSQPFGVHQTSMGTVLRYSNNSSDVLADARTLRFTAQANAHVELMADFTDWRPMSMIEIRPGLYQVTLREAIRSGPHRVNLRVDNGDWSVPKELPPVVDDFGGKAGALVVP